MKVILWRLVFILMFVLMILSSIPLYGVGETEHTMVVRVVNKGTTDLEYYPVKIVLNKTWIGWDTVLPNGTDIYFTDSYGNPLWWYPETWDYDDKLAILYVKVPYIPQGGSTEIIMHWGDPSKVPKIKIYRNSGMVKYITLRLENMNIQPGDTIAPHLYDWYFDGVDDWLAIERSNTFSWTSVTAGAYVFLTTTSSSVFFVSWSNTWASKTGFQLKTFYNLPWVVLGNGTTIYHKRLTGITYTNNWHFYAFRYSGDSDVVRIFFDTYNEAYSVGIGSIQPATKRIVIGTYDEYGSKWMFHGFMSYVFVAGIAWLGVDILSSGGHEIIDTAPIFFDPTWYNGTHYIDLLKGYVATPYGGVSRVPASEKWLWVVKGLYNDSYVHLEWFPAGSVVEFYSGGKLVLNKSITSINDTVSLTSGTYDVVAKIPFWDYKSGEKIETVAELGAGDVIAPHLYDWYFDGQDDYIVYDTPRDIVVSQVTVWVRARVLTWKVSGGFWSWWGEAKDLNGDGKREPYNFFDVGPYRDGILRFPESFGNTTYMPTRLYKFSEEELYLWHDYIVQWNVSGQWRRSWIDGSLVNEMSGYPPDVWVPKHNLKIGRHDGPMHAIQSFLIAWQNITNASTTLLNPWLVCDPSFFNGTHYLDLVSGIVGTPYGGVKRIEASEKWLWVVKGLRADSYIHLEWFPPGTLVEFYDNSTGELVDSTVVYPGNDVGTTVSLPSGTYRIVAYIPREPINSGLGMGDVVSVHIMMFRFHDNNDYFYGSIITTPSEFTILSEVNFTSRNKWMIFDLGAVNNAGTFYIYGDEFGGSTIVADLRLTVFSPDATRHDISAFTLYPKINVRHIIWGGFSNSTLSGWVGLDNIIFSGSIGPIGVRTEAFYIGKYSVATTYYINGTVRYVVVYKKFFDQYMSNMTTVYHVIDYSNILGAFDASFYYTNMYVDPVNNDMHLTVYGNVVQMPDSEKWIWIIIGARAGNGLVTSLLPVGTVITINGVNYTITGDVSVPRLYVFENQYPAYGNITITMPYITVLDTHRYDSSQVEVEYPVTIKYYISYNGVYVAPPNATISLYNSVNSLVYSTEFKSLPATVYLPADQYRIDVPEEGYTLDDKKFYVTSIQVSGMPINTTGFLLQGETEITINVKVIDTNVTLPSQVPTSGELVWNTTGIFVRIPMFNGTWVGEGVAIDAFYNSTNTVVLVARGLSSDINVTAIFYLYDYWTKTYIGTYTVYNGIVMVPVNTNTTVFYFTVYKDGVNLGKYGPYYIYSGESITTLPSDYYMFSSFFVFGILILLAARGRVSDVGLGLIAFGIIGIAISIVFGTTNTISELWVSIVSKFAILIGIIILVAVFIASKNKEV